MAWHIFHYVTVSAVHKHNGMRVSHKYKFKDANRCDIEARAKAAARKKEPGETTPWMTENVHVTAGNE